MRFLLPTRAPLFCAIGLSLAASACESPDPVAKMDDFAARTDSFTEEQFADVAPDVEDNTDVAQDTSTDTDGDVSAPCLPPDPSEGAWFFALSANLDREKPLYFEITFTLEDDGTISTVGQPLRYDVNPLDQTVPDNPRSPAGVSYTASSNYDAQGCFSLTYEEVTVTGEANGITGRDIEGTVILDGCVVGDDIAYGAMSGNITAPLALNLNGSTFAAVRLLDADYTSIDPVFFNDTIPFEPWTCEEEEGSGEGSGDM